MRRRGITVLELLIALSIVVLATLAVTRAYTGALKFQSKSAETRELHNARVKFEDEMTRYLAGAELNGGTAYLVSPIPQSLTGIAEHNSDSLLGDGSASIVLTTGAKPMPFQYLSATETDLPSLNRHFGPVGGDAEVAYSMSPAGDPGLKRGLFIREQNPPDDDVTQGGEERVADTDIRDIRFEFYDGTTWQTTWDSRNANKGTLPAAIRVTYLLLEEKTPRQFFVRLPLSFLAPGGTPAPPTTSSSGSSSGSSGTSGSTSGSGGGASGGSSGGSSGPSTGGNPS